MSSWTYVAGMVEVCVLGRTQAEMLYTFQTTLEHLPQISGSERNAAFHIIQCAGTNTSSNLDEFGNPSNLLPCGAFGKLLKTQTQYYVVIEGSLRDRTFEETYRETVEWLCRLSKRCQVCDVLIRVRSQSKRQLIDDNEKCFCEMFELPGRCPDF